LPEDVEVVVAPSFLHIPMVKGSLRKDVAVSAQNVALHSGFGAFTGETSAEMLKDAGVDWAIVGHSERREGFGMMGESNELVADKTKVAISQGLKVIACVGEKLADREGGKTMDVLNAQLQSLAKKLTSDDWAKVVIAYEPVWAIGTGKTASPQQAQETHKGIRQWLSKNVAAELAESVRIIYGGSVKGSNAQQLISEPDIDGFLVGGASLSQDFVAIINASTAVQAGSR